MPQVAIKDVRVKGLKYGNDLYFHKGDLIREITRFQDAFTMAYRQSGDFESPVYWDECLMYLRDFIDKIENRGRSTTNNIPENQLDEELFEI